MASVSVESFEFGVEFLKDGDDGVGGTTCGWMAQYVSQPGSLEGCATVLLGGLRPDGVVASVVVTLGFGRSPPPGISHVMNNMHNVLLADDMAE